MRGFAQDGQSTMRSQKMKATISALLVLGSLSTAIGATIDDAWFGISDYKGINSVIDINNTGKELALAASSTSDTIAASGYTVISGAQFSGVVAKSESENYKRAYITLTFVIDLSKLDTPDNNSLLFSDNVKWGSAITPERELKGVWNNEVWSKDGEEHSDNYTTSPLGLTDTVVLTFNTGSPKANTDPNLGSSCYSQVYLNGELIGSAKGLAHGTSVDTLFINDVFGDAIQSVYVHNKMLESQEVKELCRSIPEPTTATLSLLALVGLAARRRHR